MFLIVWKLVFQLKNEYFRCLGTQDSGGRGRSIHPAKDTLWDPVFKNPNLMKIEKNLTSIPINKQFLKTKIR